MRFTKKQRFEEVNKNSTKILMEMLALNDDLVKETDFHNFVNVGKMLITQQQLTNKLLFELIYQGTKL